MMVGGGLLVVPVTVTIIQALARRAVEVTLGVVPRALPRQMVTQFRPTTKTLRDRTLGATGTLEEAPAAVAVRILQVGLHMGPHMRVKTMRTLVVPKR